MKSKGFTLVELLAVIVIIALLSVSAISGYNTMVRNGKEKALETKVQTIENAALKFAKESNVNKKTTISVNKLVVLGYLQADESNDQGLSLINNPLTSENMICNLIDITIKDNEVRVKYRAEQKNCSLSNEEDNTSKINVYAYCLNKSDKYLAIENNEVEWVNCPTVVIRTNPARDINKNNIESVTFDNQGTSKIGKDKRFAESNVTAINTYDNLFAVESLDNVITTGDVGITYTMKDGKVYYRHVLVRIDREVPTASYVLTNDLNQRDNLERKVTLYVDDGNGSGANGYILTGPDTNKNVDDKYKDNINLKSGDYAIVPKDKVGNNGKPITFKVSNIPETMSCDVNIKKTDGTNFSTAYSYSWYNKDIKILMTSPKAVEAGTNYDLIENTAITSHSQLKKYQSNKNPINYSYNRSAEQNVLTYYGGVRNLQKATSGNDILKCSAQAGIDKTKPTVAITSELDRTVWKKKHKMTIVIEDKGTVKSGFDTSKDYYLRYAWLISTQSPTTKWSSKKLTHDGNYKLTTTIEVNTDVNGAKMTGHYKFWVKADSVKDKAQNSNDAQNTDEYAIDNTKPRCTSSGGVTDWVKRDVILVGECKDDVGTTDQSGCRKGTASGKVTYPDKDHVNRTYDYEINRKRQTPTKVFDWADNETTCPSDQTVMVDKNLPTCSITRRRRSWSPDGANFSVSCSDSGSGLVKCAGNSGLSYVRSNRWSTTGKTSSDNYETEDKVGRKGTCTFTIQTRTRYRKRTWDSCKTGSRCAYYSDWSQYKFDDEWVTSLCSDISYENTTDKKVCSKGSHPNPEGKIECDCFYYSRHCVDTCEGGWNDWSGYTYSSCTPAYHSVDCESRLEYK